MLKILNAAGLAAVTTLLVGAASVQAQDTSLTIALPAEPADIDGCNTTVTGIGVIVKENIVETLTTLDSEDSTVQPRLATDWEDIGDGTWQISLREGVTFHDGSPFNAEAVAFAVERMQSSAIACRDRTKIAGVELTTEIVDEHTINIHAEPSQVLMPTLLSFIGAVSPNTPADAISRAPVGTGPFQFASWDSNGIAVTAFEDYWGEEPQVSDALYVFRGESALRAAMVEIGEADIAHDIAPQDAMTEMDVPFLNGETTRIRMVMEPPLDDIRVREALNLAFDREALVGTILSDRAEIATQFILPKINGHNPDLEPWPYDPARAEALLEEARADGVDVDTEMRLIGRIGFFPNQEEMLQVIQQMWSQVGLNVRLEMMESADWLELVNRPYPEDRGPMLIQEQHDNNNGDASFTMHFRYHSDGQQTELSDPRIDALIEQAQIATGDERTQSFQEANRIIADEIIPAVPMYHMVSYMRVSPAIDYEPNSLSLIQLELADITFN
ncbi:ABC transporter substrate-binding protein [Pelagibacterium halotolerans]|uniref:Putative ABC transporter periplasmic oligopeptide-binding protein n=1 Tax=Pelagibacterium halotolerans (strain DSM 22347 / JCM 15775 / CGMCC 1.7692 / B2) TaxID=1082931 RepID=G4RD85_PELHB|nr:ABC transporter substrate-binding protein [Pelagibacterium halotolerans]AEQ53835.1 putative ABC transporter periplasmic oligopeptide-binding protein [Pelagibacterium halotolerans B2]QJR20015.1 peptide ABC transporter substrate-binding protein [Pelagibacterium halotolerans]SEA81929.1 peptide/nickel transport system substrate-binding protein [Pelagibacterium halotolerans]